MTVSELSKQFVNVVTYQPESHKVDVLAANLVSVLATFPGRRALAAIVYFEKIDELEDTALPLLEVMYGVKAEVEATRPDNWTYRKITLSLEDEVHVPFAGAVVTEKRVEGAKAA